MILIWCLCMCLLLLGLAHCRYLRTTLEEIRLLCFAQRIRVPARMCRADLDRSSVHASRERFWPAFQVHTRAGPHRSP